MIKDEILGTSKNTRRMLKTLGVTTYVPQAVATDVLHASDRNPVSYLTRIKDFVTSKTSRDGTNIRKDGTVVAKTLSGWPFLF